MAAAANRTVSSVTAATATVPANISSKQRPTAPIRRQQNRQISSVMVGQFENGRLYGMESTVLNSEHESVRHVYQQLNARALKDFHKLHGFFSPNNNDVIIDFGCGAGGETTLGMAKGQLLHEQPKQVIGLDISQNAIDTCMSEYEGSASNLSFVQLDTSDEEQKQEFLDKWRNRISLVTAFTSLHQVQDMPATIHFFAQLLKDGGKMVALVPTQPRLEKEGFARAFDEVLHSAKWTERLRGERGGAGAGGCANDYWMRTSKEYVMAADLQNLLAQYGFITEQLKDVHTRLTLSVCDTPELLVNLLPAAADQKVATAADVQDIQDELMEDVKRRYVQLTHTEHDGRIPYHYTDVLSMFRIMAIKH